MNTFTATPCPTCGRACRVITGDEGTSHFEPIGAERYREQRDQLLSQIKQHRNATESRLRLLASAARQPESSDLLLKPDRDLYATAQAIERPTHNSNLPELRGEVE